MGLKNLKKDYITTLPENSQVFLEKIWGSIYSDPARING
jgi:hypothetical protein